METFSFLSQTYEGKDKIIKFFQYYTKYCSWYYLRSTQEVSVNFFLVSEKVRETRQLFRLFKSIFELKRIQIISRSNTDKFLKITNIASRFFYLLFWAADNVQIISKVCRLNKLYPNFIGLEKIRKLARIFWLAGLTIFLVICLKIIRKTYTDESDLKVAALNKMTVK